MLKSFRIMALTALAVLVPAGFAPAQNSTV